MTDVLAKPSPAAGDFFHTSKEGGLGQAIVSQNPSNKLLHLEYLIDVENSLHEFYRMTSQLAAKDRLLLIQGGKPILIHISNGSSCDSGRG